MTAIAAQDLEALAERADDALRLATMPALLSTARAMLNEAGLAARQNKLDAAVAVLRDGPKWVREAGERLIEAQERERQARAAHDDAMATAEWEIEATRFTKEGRDTFLRSQCETCKGTKHAPVPNEPEFDVDTPCPTCDGAGEIRKPLTADERRAWLARAAAGKCRPTADALERASHAVAMAKVDVGAAEDRWHAARYAVEAARTQVDGAIATVGCLARTLGGER